MSDDQQSSWLSKMGDVLGIDPSESSAPQDESGSSETPESEKTPAEEEGSWVDAISETVSHTVETVSDWATGNSPTDERGQPPADGGSGAEAGQATSKQEDEEKGWFDRAADTVSEVYQDLTGDDEDEDEEVVDDDEEAAKLVAAEYASQEDGEEDEDDGETGWDQLTPAQQNAWTVLGWNAESWAHGPPPASSNKSWQELTDLERSAAKSLGYDEAKWDNETDELQYAWDNLTPTQQNAWAVLGWNRENWEHGPPPASAGKKWQDLSAAERAAAESLGYDEAKWDRQTAPLPESGWDALTPTEQNSWSVLGWTRENWDYGPAPPSSSKSWSQLSTAERNAAKSLGYDESKWDEENDVYPEPEQDGDALPTVAFAHTSSIDKSFKYISVDSVSICGKFAPKKGADREYTVTKDAFESAAKAELKTQLSDSIDVGGGCEISTGGAKAALGASGKTKLTQNLDVTFEIEITVIQVEFYDSTKKQKGTRIGPLVIATPSIVPKGGLSTEVDIAGIPGTLSATIAISISPNYGVIAQEVAEKLGLKMLKGAGGIAFGIIEAGYQTIVINYKHIIYRVNPDTVVEARDATVKAAMAGYKDGLLQTGGGSGDSTYTSALTVGAAQRAEIYRQLRDGSDVDWTELDAAVAAGVKEAISNGALSSAKAHFTSQANQACWNRYKSEYPDDNTATKMAVACALWGADYRRTAPSRVRRELKV